MTAVLMTNHAALRLRTRFGRRDIEWVRDVHSRSVKVPPRYGRQAWGRNRGKKSKTQMDYRASATIVLVMRRKLVITVIRVLVDDLATVLVWLMMGIWDAS